MIVTEELIRLLSFCEAHKYKSMVYKNSIELKKALKVNDHNLKFLSAIEEYDKPYNNLCFYDEDIHVAFSIGVIRHSEDSLSTFKLMKRDYIPPVEKTLSRMAINFLTKKEWKIENHYFLNEEEHYEIETWDKSKLDFGVCQREAESTSFWVHGLIQKKFKPHVSEKSCSVCKLKNGCKNYRKLSTINMDDTIAEFVT